MSSRWEKVEAVIFDMDGVIVDSMREHVQAWYEAFNEYGIEASKEDIFSMEGYKLEEVIEELVGGELPQEEIDQLEDEKHRRFDHEQIRIFPEIDRLLSAMSDKLKLAVVTGSNLREVDKLIPPSVADKFEFIISSEDYKQGKPNPDPYLTAVSRLELDKDQVVVVENAPAGVTSAKRAGLRVIGIPTYINREELDEADLLVVDHKELETVLQKYY